MNYLLRLLLTLFTILCGTTISGASIQESHAGAVFEKTCVFEREAPFSAEFVAPKRLGTPPGCFVAGTLVTTEDGQKPIEEVKVGEKVWSYNQETKKWELREVVDTYTLDYEGDVVTLKIGEEKIVATGNHPIWVTEGESLSSRPRVESELASHEHALTKEGRWVEARHLQSGDKLSLNGGEYTHLDSINSETRKVEVFNFHVEGNHNYTVSKLGVLVHNSSGMSSPNQMNQAIQRGKAPKGLTRVDVAKVKGEKPHVHFKDGSALNFDGTWKHGGTKLTKKQQQWIQENGWSLPK